MAVYRKNDWIELSSMQKTKRKNNYPKRTLNRKKWLNLLYMQINKRMSLPLGKVLLLPHLIHPFIIL